jgi:hypothetical protein
MDANTLLFGSLTLVSVVAFFFLGRFKASAKQTERDDRIDWTQRRFSLWKIFLYSLVLVGGVALLTTLV